MITILFFLEHFWSLNFQKSKLLEHFLIKDRYKIRIKIFARTFYQNQAPSTFAELSFQGFALTFIFIFYHSLYIKIQNPFKNLKTKINPLLFKGQEKIQKKQPLPLTLAPPLHSL